MFGLLDLCLHSTPTFLYDWGSIWDWDWVLRLKTIHLIRIFWDMPLCQPAKVSALVKLYILSGARMTLSKSTDHWVQGDMEHICKAMHFNEPMIVRWLCWWPVMTGVGQGDNNHPATVVAHICPLSASNWYSPTSSSPHIGLKYWIIQTFFQPDVPASPASRLLPGNTGHLHGQGVQAQGVGADVPRH